MHGLIVGCGYLGLRVAHSWLERGETVTALTRSTTRAAQLQVLGISPIVGDVTDSDTLTSLPDADVLLYAVGFDRTSGHTQRTVYVDGLANVLAACRGRASRLLYVSSTSVYGQCEGEWVDEASACAPATDNGRICLEAEQQVIAWSHGTGVTSVILRMAGLYGPGRLIARAETLRTATPLAGLADAWLNLIHIDDAASAGLAAAAADDPAACYLVSDDRPVTRGEFYGRFAQLIGAPPPTFNPSLASQRTPGLNKRCRNARLRSSLLPKLRYPTIDEGLPHALQETPTES